MAITDEHVLVVNTNDARIDYGQHQHPQMVENEGEEEKPLGHPTWSFDPEPAPTANVKRPAPLSRQTSVGVINSEGEMPLGQPTIAFGDTVPDCPDELVVNEASDEEQPMGVPTWNFD